MSDLNNNINDESGIDKFDGTFEKEESGCTIFVNETVNSIKKLDVLGLYSYLVCRPPSWKLNVKHLASLFSCNKDKIYQIIDSLILIKLLSRKEIRNKGKFVRFHYRVHLRPTSIINTDEEPCLEKPDTVKPDTVFPDTYKTKSVLNKEDKNTTTSSDNFFEGYKEKEESNLAALVGTKEKENIRAKTKQYAITNEKCLEVFSLLWIGLNVTIDEAYDSCQGWHDAQGKDLVVAWGNFVQYLKNDLSRKPFEPIKNPYVNKSNGYSELSNPHPTSNQINWKEREEWNNQPKEVLETKRKNGQQKIGDLLKSMQR